MNNIQNKIQEETFRNIHYKTGKNVDSNFESTLSPAWGRTFRALYLGIEDNTYNQSNRVLHQHLAREFNDK